MLQRVGDRQVPLMGLKVSLPRVEGVCPAACWYEGSGPPGALIPGPCPGGLLGLGVDGDRSSPEEVFLPDGPLSGNMWARSKGTPVHVGGHPEFGAGGGGSRAGFLRPGLEGVMSACGVGVPELLSLKAAMSPAVLVHWRSMSTSLVCLWRARGACFSPQVVGRVAPLWGAQLVV